jgi:hypothetical protein
VSSAELEIARLMCKSSGGAMYKSDSESPKRYATSLLCNSLLPHQKISMKFLPLLTTSLISPDTIFV